MLIDTLGDIATLTAARRAARDGFQQQQSLTVQSKEANDAIEYSNSVAQILRENVVQGKATEASPDKYSMIGSAI